MASVDPNQIGSVSLGIEVNQAQLDAALKQAQGKVAAAAAETKFVVGAKGPYQQGSTSSPYDVAPQTTGAYYIEPLQEHQKAAKATADEAKTTARTVEDAAAKVTATKGAFAEFRSEVVGARRALGTFTLAMTVAGVAIYAWRNVVETLTGVARGARQAADELGKVKTAINEVHAAQSKTVAKGAAVLGSDAVSKVDAKLAMSEAKIADLEAEIGRYRQKGFFTRPLGETLELGRAEEELRMEESTRRSLSEQRRGLLGRAQTQSPGQFGNRELVAATTRVAESNEKILRMEERMQERHIISDHKYRVAGGMK